MRRSGRRLMISPLERLPSEFVFKPIGVRERDLLARLRELGYPVG